MHKSIYFFVALFLGVTVFGQKNEVETIKWSVEKLVWEDFKGKPNPSKDHHAASTRSGITYSWSYTAKPEGIDLDFDVFSNFYPESSWVISGEETPALLAHEQLHFDISELFARKLLKAFQAYVPMRNIRRDLTKIYQQIEAERKRTQLLYDRQTNHGLLKEAQQEWEMRIAEELEKTDQKKSISN